MLPTRGRARAGSADALRVVAGISTFCIFAAFSSTRGLPIAVHGQHRIGYALWYAITSTCCNQSDSVWRKFRGIESWDKELLL